MKTVILCGGQGMRLREHFLEIPKPLISIGEKPILEHIMQHYSGFGFREFILCLGYKSEEMAAHFGSKKEVDFFCRNGEARVQYNDWLIDLVFTGNEENTGGRIFQIQHLIAEENFFATYADGLSNIDLSQLYAFHLQHNKTATLTAVTPHVNFGVLEIGANEEVRSFQEKPKLEKWISGGFFVFKKNIFRVLRENDVLEVDAFSKLVVEKELIAYRHNGFWMCMDTYKDYLTLNHLAEEKAPPWKNTLNNA